MSSSDIELDPEAAWSHPTDPATNIGSDEIDLLSVAEMPSRPPSSGEPPRFDLRPESSGIASRQAHHDLNYEALSSWVYPVNMPVRDYQRNIIRKALTRNMICALPTGLGKTFIASVIMLNFWRWTKSSKCIFMAPTRPLVAQQVQSFLEMSGVPISETSALLQDVVPRVERISEWKNKRVFFATPQTVENDLRSGLVDPKDIVCLVVDEAHRATGNHSYVNVVNTILKKNPFVRILGLTATPSGKLDGVQTIIDNLHISQTEIRGDENLDIKQYSHGRDCEKVVVKNSAEQERLLDLVAAALKKPVAELYRAGVVHTNDPTNISHFAIITELRKLSSLPSYQHGPEKWRFYRIRAVAGIVQRIAYATMLLKTHGIFPFYERLNDICDSIKTSKGKNAQALKENSDFKQLVKETHDMIYDADEKRKPTFIGHPKLLHLVDIVADFLLQKGADSRIIIFAEFRESAAEIAWVLSIHCPEFVRARLFVGQTTKAKDSAVKGMSQKEQQALIGKFRAGDINVIVATSIAEEGLDIGEVDMIICYDQSRSPIRNIQRMGRTGRKRKGAVYMLMTEKEESKLDLALQGHKYIQSKINFNSAAPVKLQYHMSERIIPREAGPQYREIFVETPAENSAALSCGDIISAMKPKRRRSTPKPAKQRGTKRSRLDDESTKDAEIDKPGADSTDTLGKFGFISVSELQKSEIPPQQESDIIDLTMSSP